MSILILADHDHTALSAYTLSVLTAAQAIGGAIDILVCGKGSASVAQAAAALPSIGKVFHAEHDGFAEFIAENIAPVVLKLARDNGYTHILTAATSVGKGVMPRVAALLDVQQISDIIAVESPSVFRRPIYAGNAIATVESTDSVKIITVRSTAFDKAATSGGSGAIEAVSVDSAFAGSSFVKKEISKSERPQLGTASVVISGGRGLGSGENFSILEKLADRLGGAIGASRAAVDAGFVPNDYQVGQTGKVVAPNLYIAVGISGAIQHLAGMKDSKVIVAINKDADAPIFQVADYGIVGDLFEIVPELTRKI